MLTHQDDNISNLIINKMTKALYESITPDSKELYFITDDVGVTAADLVGNNIIGSSTIPIYWDGNSFEPVTIGTTGLFYRGDGTWSNTLILTSNSALGIDSSSKKIGNALRDINIRIATTSGNGDNSGNAGGITFVLDNNGALAGIYCLVSSGYGTRLHFATTGSFSQGAYSRMIITHTGDVGIGVLSPSTKLHVDGNITINGLTASLAVTTNANKKLVSTDLTVSDSTLDNGIQYVYKVTLEATGKITATKSIIRNASTSLTGVLQFTDTNTNAQLNTLSTDSSVPQDADYYISLYVGGGTTTTSYHRRPMSALWSYVKGKITSDIPTLYWANQTLSNAASYNTTPEVASVKIGNGTTATSTKNVVLQYDSTNEVLNFVFT